MQGNRYRDARRHGSLADARSYQFENHGDLHEANSKQDARWSEGSWGQSGGQIELNGGKKDAEETQPLEETPS
jgi:hypothetical protein